MKDEAMPGPIDRQDLRRHERIPADFCAMVQGVDGELHQRRGNISRSGIIFGTDEDGIEAGNLEYLHLTTLDRRGGIVVMANAVRVVSLEGIVGAPRRAIAFEFMPESPARRQELDELIAAICGQQPKRAPRLEPRAGQVLNLNVTQLQFDATWPIDVGETVQLVVQSRGASRIPFEGQVSEVVAAPAAGNEARYRVKVAMHGAGLRAKRAPRSLTESIDIAMSELVSLDLPRNPDAERPHLHGSLERISIGNLLSWFEMGRMSGRLSVSNATTRYALFIEAGVLVDIEPAGPGAPLDVVADVFRWKDGHFEFAEGPLGRPARLNESLSMLILEVARQSDEDDRGLSSVA